MPAANALMDDGTLGMTVDPGGSSALRVGAQDMSTMANADIDNRYCNVHVALIFLLSVGFVVLLRKNGIHALSLEG